MLDRLKKIVVSLSVIVLFALYALQEKTQSPFGSSAVGSGHVATVTSRDSASRSTVTPAPSRPSMTVTPSESDPVQTVTPVGLHPVATATARGSSPAKRVTPTPSATATAEGAYVDGTYTGNPADANWGNVEVQAVITNGQIGDVQFLQYPNHRSRSRSINDHAMPLLTQEAIQSQQAEVDVVTGATDTSYAFIQSLASALRQAAA